MENDNELSVMRIRVDGAQRRMNTNLRKPHNKQVYDLYKIEL